jgi:hypothetical protein
MVSRLKHAQSLCSRKVNSMPVKFAVSCMNDPTGEQRMVFILTPQQSRTDFLPHKSCARCNRVFPSICFVKTIEYPENGYGIITDSDICHFCVKPDVFKFHRDNRGRLKMRLVLRDVKGQLIKMWDKKDEEWRTVNHFGLRLMTDTNQIRLQPYRDRHSKW